MDIAETESPGTGFAQHLGQLLATWATRTPTSAAILAPERAPLTYGMLAEQVEQTVAALRSLGIGRGDRVVLALPDGPEASVAILSVAIGATAVPTDPQATATEAADWFAAVRPGAVVVAADADIPARTAAKALGLPVLELTEVPSAAAGRFVVAATPGPPTRAVADTPPHPQDVAFLLATSGTTGQARRVPLTHANMCAAAAAKGATFGLSPADRSLSLTANFHIYHLSHLVLSLATGGSTVCPAMPDADDFFHLLKSFRPTRMTAIPAMLRAIVERSTSHAETVAPTSLRMVHSGAVSLSPALLAQVEAALQAPVLEGYGLTETAATLASNPPPPLSRKPGSVGTASGCDVAIIDEENRRLAVGAVGEVIVRGPYVMDGYDGDPAATAAAFTPDGWFRTGDLGHFDADGYLFLSGRLKELINRGGAKVSPLEVEGVLRQHPAVAAAAVFALPNERLGEEVAAAVVRREGGVVTERELRAFAADLLSSYKIPHRVVFVDGLPTGRTGKPLRVGLADVLGLHTSPPRTSEAIPREEGQAVGAPRTAIEAAVVGVWRFLFGMEQIGVGADFFDLGGHSLLVAELTVGLREALGVELPPSTIFAAPTVAELAARIEEIRRGTAGAAPGPGRWLVPLQAGSRRAVFLVPGGRGGDAALFRFAHLARHVGSDRPFYGFLAGEVDATGDAQRWAEATAAAYVLEMRAHQPEGPYFLFGGCVGGLLALEMGQQICSDGNRAPALILLDTRRPGPRGTKGGATPPPTAPSPLRRGDRLRAPRTRQLLRYSPKPYPGRIVLLANEEWLQDDPGLGWDALAQGGLNVVPLPGQHGTYLRHHTAALAAQVRSVLEELDAGEEQ